MHLHADAAVEERLTTMWWPQIEYVNTSEPTITNQSLEIFPSGRVKLTVGMTSTFRATLDLRRFPFDRQHLDVRIQSLLYEEDRVSICLTALLACIATHFAISFNLPHVGYLTVIDRLFVATYTFVALLVLASAWELSVRHDATTRRRVNGFAAAALPLAYLVLVSAFILR